MSVSAGSPSAEAGRRMSQPGESPRDERLTGWEARAEAAAREVSALSRELRLLTPRLEGRVFAQPSILERLRRVAITDRRADFRFLLHPDCHPNRANAALVELARRLTGRMAFRHLPDSLRDETRECLIVDRRSLLSLTAPEARTALLQHDPRRARAAAAEFDRLWETAVPAAEFRALHL